MNCSGKNQPVLCSLQTATMHRKKGSGPYPANIPFANPYQGIIYTAMRSFIRGGLILILVGSAAIFGFCQLRNLSEYGQDCINTDETYFVLHDTGAAEFGWASEWTHLSANNYPEKMAMVVWNFKNGSKAFSKVIELLGDAGGIAGYFLSGKSSELKSTLGKDVQPMTRDNYPVKIELCLGEFTKSAGFRPETLVDTLCLDAQKIEYNQMYRFTQCSSEAGKD